MLTCPAREPGGWAFPGIAPLAPGTSQGSLTPWVGLATPQAVRVRLVFFGHPFSAPVVPVPMPGGKTVGVFLIWLRIPAGTSSFGGSDISSETAYDAAGHVVGQHGPWK